MRVVLLLLSCVTLGTLACDQLNKPMPVPPSGSSASSTGSSSTPVDAGRDADLPALPGEGPHVTPQPGDVQL
ncbi:MAG: hypothetical protein U0270_05560 [Labilithrix sp.]